MDQPKRNREFVEANLLEIYEKLTRINDLFDYLCKDEGNPFLDLMNKTKKIKDEHAKKMFILMEYTKYRESTNYLADVLTKLNMKELADMLTKFNKSEKFFDYSDRNGLTVQKVVSSNTGSSMCYPMEAHPRGLCIIILNEDSLEAEAQDFKLVFRQLYFTVKIKRRQTSQQIRQLFQNISADDKYKHMNALITVAIGYTQDECFLGAGSDQNPVDQVPIFDLVDAFNENRCQAFKGKPKINLFISGGQSNFNLAQSFNKTWKNANPHTTVIFSSPDANGPETQYDKQTGVSYFGRAFIYTIAQFACDKHFGDLLTEINKRLVIDGMPQLSPQVVKAICPLNVYFNPGK